MREIDVLEKFGDKHWYLKSKRAVLMKEMLRAFNFRGSYARILIVGCGAGYLVRDLEKFFWKHSLINQVFSMDIDDEALFLTKTKSTDRVKFVRASVCDMPFEEGYFDLVIMADVLEHVEDEFAAMTEIARALKPKGKLIMTVPAGMELWSYHDEDLGHYCRYSKKKLRQLLDFAGFGIKKCQYWNSISYLPLLVIRRLWKVTSHDMEKASIFQGGITPFMESWLFFESNISFFPKGVTLLAVAEKQESIEPVVYDED